MGAGAASGETRRDTTSYQGGNTSGLTDWLAGFGLEGTSLSFFFYPLFLLALVAKGTWRLLQGTGKRAGRHGHRE